MGLFGGGGIKISAPKITAPKFISKAGKDLEKVVSKTVKNPGHAYKNYLLKPTTVATDGLKKGFQYSNSLIGQQNTNMIATGVAASYGVPPSISGQVLGGIINPTPMPSQQSLINPAQSAQSYIERKSDFSSMPQTQNFEGSSKIPLYLGIGAGALVLILLIFKRK